MTRTPIHDEGVLRCLRLIGERDPIASQREAPGRIARLVAGLGEDVLARRPPPGGWSMREVLGHLADHEVVLGYRERIVAAQDRPPLTGYDQEAFVRRLLPDGRSAAELLDAFRAVRAINVALLERLPPEAFARVGLHSERGEESLEHMVRLYAGHDLVHEAQIARIRAAVAG
jgi:DinB superfamily